MNSGFTMEVHVLQPSFNSPLLGFNFHNSIQCCRLAPAAGEIHRLKKWQSLAEFLAGDRMVKHNRHLKRQHSLL